MSCTIKMIRSLLRQYKPNEFYAWYGSFPQITIDEQKLFKWHTSNSEACTSQDPPSQAEDTRKESLSEDSRQ